MKSAEYSYHRSVERRFETHKYWLVTLFFMKYDIIYLGLTRNVINITQFVLLIPLRTVMSHAQHLAVL